MSFSGTNYGDISPRVGLFAVAKMLDHAQPLLVLEKFALTQALPKNKGLNIKWRRPIPFDVSPTALTEGVTPVPTVMEYEDVSATISQYGGWVGFTDVIQDTHEDPVLNDMSTLCSEQAASTKEALVWSVIRGGTSVIYSGVATSRATVVATIVDDELRSAQRILKTNHGKHITSMIGATSNIATEPVAPAFLAFGHTNLEQDLRDALVHDQLCLEYQPIVSTKTDTVTGVEALMRWNHPDFGRLVADRQVGEDPDPDLAAALRRGRRPRGRRGTPPSWPAPGRRRASG